MYKEYLKKQKTLKKAYIDLLEIIMEEKSYNEEHLELLLSIGKSMLVMKEALFITIKECTFKNNNYNILKRLLERLETETDEKWNLDYFTKTNNNDQEVTFIVLKKEDYPLDFIATQSYEELHKQAEFGNTTEDYLIYEEKQNQTFELGYYLTSSKPHLQKFFKEGYNFSTNYSMLQEEIINMVMNSYEINYKKLKQRKK